LRTGKDFGDYRQKVGEFESLNRLVEIMRSLNYQSQKKEEKDDDTDGHSTNDRGSEERTVRGPGNSFFAEHGESYTSDLDRPASGPPY
jgi:hypothetical protein